MRSSEIEVGKMYRRYSFGTYRDVRVLEKFAKGNLRVEARYNRDSKTRRLKKGLNPYSLNHRPSDFETIVVRAGDPYETTCHSRDLMFPVDENGNQLPCKSWDEKRLAEARRGLAKAAASETSAEIAKYLAVLGVRAEAMMVRLKASGSKESCVVIAGEDGEMILELLKPYVEKTMVSLIGEAT